MITYLRDYLDVMIVEVILELEVQIKTEISMAGAREIPGRDPSTLIWQERQEGNIKKIKRKPRIFGA